MVFLFSAAIFSLRTHLPLQPPEDAAKMEPTANHSRNTETRPSSNPPTPATSPPPISDIDAATDPLSSWDGPGTAYRVMPGTLARGPHVVPQPITNAIAPDHMTPSPTPEPGRVGATRRPAINGPVCGGVAVGALLASLLLVLWSGGMVNELQHSNGADASPGSVAHPPASATAPRHEQDTVAAATAAREETSSETLHLPSAAPLPRQLPAPTTAVSEPSPPAGSTAVAAQAAPSQTLPATTVQSRPPVAGQPKPAQPTPVAKAQPATMRPMSITQKHPARPTQPQARSNTSAPVAVGTLTVAITPWGEVWINGRKRGISPPLFKLQLPPGRHTVELRNAGHPSFSQTLQISAGQSVTLRHSFQQRQPSASNTDSPSP